MAKASGRKCAGCAPPAPEECSARLQSERRPTERNFAWRSPKRGRMARLMLTVLRGRAEFERDLIRSRTGEARERAEARGVKLGRKPKLTMHQQRKAIRRRDEIGETLADIARSYNVSRSTISRLTA